MIVVPIIVSRRSSSASTTRTIGVCGSVTTYVLERKKLTAHRRRSQVFEQAARVPHLFADFHRLMAINRQPLQNRNLDFCDNPLRTSVKTLFPVAKRVEDNLRGKCERHAWTHIKGHTEQTKKQQQFFVLETPVNRVSSCSLRCLFRCFNATRNHTTVSRRRQQQQQQQH